MEYIKTSIILYKSNIFLLHVKTALLFWQVAVKFLCVYSRACERSGAGSERVVERAQYSRSAERVFIQRPERSLCLAPVSLQYRSHHESRACTNPPRIHLCLQQLTKPSKNKPTLQKSFVVKERWSSWNISKSKPTGHTGAQFLSKNR